MKKAIYKENNFILLNILPYWSNLSTCTNGKQYTKCRLSLKSYFRLFGHKRRLRFRFQFIKTTYALFSQIHVGYELIIGNPIKTSGDKVSMIIKITKT